VEKNMPLHFCHPSAPHKRLRLPEWYISNLMLERALDAVIRRVHRLDREHDIPYLAGYNIDGTIIYIDRHMPNGFKYRGQVVETDRFLILHEEVEKTLIDRLNLHYLHAHQIAARAEQAAVRACGINWRDYDDFMQDNVKHIGSERLSKVPADLDLKPYRDEHDTELLIRMARAVERGDHPDSHHPEKLSRAVHETIQHIKANGGGHYHRHREQTQRKAKGAKSSNRVRNRKSRKRR
jgi:sRNA-binding regulator protein Hfq